MRNLVSKENAGKRESSDITARGRIEVGIIFRTEKTVEIEKLQAELQKADCSILWDDPQIEETQVLFPVQFAHEDIERASNETVREYLTRLSGINTKLLDKKLSDIAENLEAKQLAGVTKVTPIFDIHSTLT